MVGQPWSDANDAPQITGAYEKGEIVLTRTQSQAFRTEEDVVIATGGAVHVDASPAGVQQKEEIDTELAPNEFLCPITCELMDDPVLAHDGHSYERAAILNWFRNKRTSPITNVQLSSCEVFPNYALKSQITRFREEQSSRQAQDAKEPPAKE